MQVSNREPAGRTFALKEAAAHPEGGGHFVEPKRKAPDRLWSVARTVIGRSFVRYSFGISPDSLTCAWFQSVPSAELGMDRAATGDFREPRCNRRRAAPIRWF
jgi:hypothetical protein